ncbi:MAG: hypothetical protein ACLFPI_08365 [Desulfobacterales bacterium]
MDQGRSSGSPAFSAAFPDASSLEKEYFEELAARTGGRPKAMARMSDLSLPSIYELFKTYRP